MNYSANRPKLKLSHALAVTSAVLLLIGVVRASQDQYDKKRQAIYAQCVEQQKQQGLTDRVALYGKYPTPEVAFVRMTRLVPGATGEVSVRGQFVPGTQFLFDNDDVEVIQQTPGPTGYHATVRALPNAPPGIAALHAITPVSGAEANIPAIYIGGKYEWDFTASNGWRVVLQVKDEGFQATASSPPHPVYSAQFYHGAETQPFETRDLSLSLDSSVVDSYSGSLNESAPGGSQNAQAQMQELSKQLMNPNLSEADREKLMARLQELSQQMMQQSNQAIQQMQDPNYIKNMQEKQAEFGCQSLSFRLRGNEAQGQVTCGQNVGTLQLTGLMKFVGP